MAKWLWSSQKMQVSDPGPSCLSCLDKTRVQVGLANQNLVQIWEILENKTNDVLKNGW